MSDAPVFDPSVWRSLLFVPMLQERFIVKAAIRQADGLILDLEDAVAPSEKARAHAELAGVVTRLRAQGQTVLVRINNINDLLADDLAAARDARVDAVVLPKAEEPAQVARAADRLRTIPLIPIIESARGLINAFAIASLDGVAALAFGSEDFAADMGISPEESALKHPAQHVAIAARAAGKPAFGLPGSIAIVADEARFHAIATDAKAIGMTGAMAIHPAQVIAINSVFSSSDAERAEAERIRNAYEASVSAGQGAISIDGRMIDQPVYLRALRTLSR